jgi:hypothetical protein
VIARLRSLGLPGLAVASAVAVVAILNLVNPVPEPGVPRGDGRYRPLVARGDGHMYFLMAQSIVYDRDLVFDDQLARFGDPWNQKRTPTGRKGIPHPIGPPLVYAPLLAAAQGIALVANAAGAGIPEHGYTLFHHRLVFFSSVLFAAGAVVLGAWVARRLGAGRWAAAYAAIAILLGTSLTYYATNMPSYGHAMDAFFVALFLAAWIATLGDLRLRRFALLGALLGIAALVRNQELGLGAVVALELAARAAREPRRLPALVAGGLVFAAAALAAFAPQLYAWWAVYGDALALPQGPRYTRPAHPVVLEVLFSSRNGWFSTTPLAYAGALGLALVVPRHRLAGAGLVLALAVQVYLSSTIYDWWGSASYGQRRLCSMTLPIVVGLAALLTAAGALGRRVPRAVRHLACVLVLGWFVAWNLDRVHHLRAGRSAGDPAGPCCPGVSPALAAIAKPVYRLAGNPFSQPAAALFALRHGVDRHRWDVVVGNHAMNPGLDPLGDGSYARERTVWNLAARHAEKYLIAGFGPPEVDGKQPFRRTTAARARAFVMILLPDRLAARLPVAGEGEVVVRWNGREVARTGATAAWQEIGFEVGPSVVTNVLEIEAPPGLRVGGVALSYAR